MTLLLIWVRTEEILLAKIILIAPTKKPSKETQLKRITAKTPSEFCEDYVNSADQEGYKGNAIDEINSKNTK